MLRREIVILITSMYASMYVGKSPKVEESHRCQLGDLVNFCCETLCKELSFKRYFDYWFTCLKLQLQLLFLDIWSFDKTISLKPQRVHIIIRKLKRKCRGLIWRWTPTLKWLLG